MTIVDVWARVAVERRTLADFLETLSPGEWDVPSLCRGWKVRDVVAHVAWAAMQPQLPTMLGYARGGFRVNRVNAENARGWAGCEPAVMVERLRAVADDRRHSSIITDRHVLADLMVHDLDVRRPLGRSRDLPVEAFRLTADLLADTGGLLGTAFARSPRRTVRGLRLIATDLDWSHGQGRLEVRGSAEALLLALTGRPIATDELTGSGVAALYARLR